MTKIFKIIKIIKMFKMIMMIINIKMIIVIKFIKIIKMIKMIQMITNIKMILLIKFIKMIKRIKMIMINQDQPRATKINYDHHRSIKISQYQPRPSKSKLSCAVETFFLTILCKKMHKKDPKSDMKDVKTCQKNMYIFKKA